MATAVFFHAHPDDEVLFTGGTMARAAAEGHRVVLVTATRGERGVDRSGGVSSSETLGQRREDELHRAARLLNTHRWHLLGYQDSGIDGAAVDGFCHAPTLEAAERLAEIIAAEGADVLVTYDERGIYGHPDHVQVHKVGLRAAELTDLGSVFLATVDRDRLEAMLRLAQTFGVAIDDQTLDWAVMAGVSGGRITTTVDVTGYIGSKRQALAAHQTQFPAESGVLTLPEPGFRAVFGTEWYIEMGASRHRSWLWEP